MIMEFRTIGKDIYAPARRWLMAGLLAAVCGWSGSLMAERRITMVSDPWPPYVYGELGGTASSGIAVELAQEIFSRLGGIDLHLLIIPWKRALLEVERGYYDGIPMLLKTAEREEYLVYSIPMLVGRNLAWSLESDSGEYFEWQGLGDFSGRRVGIIQDYSYGQSFDQEIADGTLRVITVPSVSHLFDMLVNGRLDVALANDAVGMAMAKKYPESRIRAAKRPTDTDIFFLALSKKSAYADLMPEINKIIRELQDEGYIERLVHSN